MPIANLLVAHRNSEDSKPNLMNRLNLTLCGTLCFISLHTFSQTPVAKIEAILEQKFKYVVNRCHDPQTYFFGVLNISNIDEKEEDKIYMVEGDYTFLCGEDTYFNKFIASLKKYQDDFILTEIKTTNSKNLGEYWVVYPKAPKSEKSKKSNSY